MTYRYPGLHIPLALGLLLGACGPMPPEAEDLPEATESQKNPLLGGASYGGDCSPSERAILDRARLYGRVASSTPAFEQCVDRVMRLGLSSGVTATGFSTGPYRQCNGDPYFGAGLGAQRTAVLDAARSANDLEIQCSSSTDIASASLGSYGRFSPESMNFGPWLSTAANTPASAITAAGAIWHEAMHQHGYTHGANSQEAAIGNCGYSGDATWNFQVNTMPYLLGDCLEEVLRESVNTCGNIENCGAGSLKLVTGLGALSCECVADPTGPSTRTSGAFTHTTSAYNTSGHITTMDHPTLNGNPDAKVHFFHVFNPTGGAGAYNGNPAAAWYNYATGRWVIANMNNATMPLGTGFSVRVGRGSVHRSNTSNSSGHQTTLEHLLANGDPEALIQISPTPYAGVWSGTTNNHPIGVWFDSILQRWRVFNQDIGTMPTSTGFSFDVEMPANRGLAFLHAATSANTTGHVTFLDHPMLNENPAAKILVTPNWSKGERYIGGFLGLWFNGSRWAIYTESGTGPGPALPLGSAFNIEILVDDAHRWVKVPESSSWLSSGLTVGASDHLRVHASGRIWSGWLLSPEVGPQGETLLGDNPGYPLVGAPRYGLVGTLGSGAFFLGRDAARGGTQGTGLLSLRTNDDVPGNGSGFFSAEVHVFR